MAMLLTVLIIISLLIVMIFYKQFKGLILVFTKKIEAAESFSLGDSHIDFKPPLFHVPDQNYSVDQVKAYADLMEGTKNPILASFEKNITNQLEKSKLPSSKCIDALREALAAVQLFNALLLIEKNIFKQQVNLLYYLNTSISATKEDLTIFYTQWQKETEPKIKEEILKYEPISFDQFLSFILNLKLIKVISEKYYIDILGKEFLSYLVKIGRKI